MNVTGIAGVPDSEYSETFLQGMVNRMGMSFFKYGLAADAYPSRINAIDSLLLRLRAYMGVERLEAAFERVRCTPDRRHRREAGNTEYLMDAANFAMIEFMHPSIEGATFEATDSDGSTGRVTAGGSVSVDPNTEDAKFKSKLYSREGD